jgi:lipopolysaccharide transport system permease protein
MSYRGLDNPWLYRHFVVEAIRGEIKRQFARSTFGALWLVLHPLARAAVYAVVFSELIVVRMPGDNNVFAYTIYLMAGMSAWGLFNDVVMRCATIFVEYEATMKKIPVSHFCMPAIACGGALFAHALLLLALMLVSIFLGVVPGLAWVSILAGMAILLLFGAGLGVILGVFQVFKRDVAQVAGIALQLWFWMTPVIYLSANLPKKFHWIADLNPLRPVVAIYQDAMLYDRFPAMAELAAPFGIGVALCLMAALLLRRASGDLVDAL